MLRGFFCLPSMQGFCTLTLFNRESCVTNKIALGLGLIILAVFAADYFLFGGALPVFLAKKFINLTEYIAFWR